MVVAAIRRFAREHKGRPPRMLEWQDKALETEQRPTSKTVFNVFGSWNKAVHAAGLKPVKAQGGVKGATPVAKFSDET